MSYKALYRKYRPQNFEQVVGQENIVLTLKNALKAEKIAHAYLFAGPRGTGKTSVAHIFAAEINQSASGNKELNPLDLIEIDAASHNGVAEVRSLIEASKYAPHQEKYKIYIIDEVHMLTKGAFNALLKTLEEPPAHVIFILATTEPEKMPITILSRLQRFNFLQIDQAIITTQLMKIFDQENITYDQAGVRLIASLAQGSLRDALSIADQAAAFSDNQISFTNVAQAFNVTSLTTQMELLNFAWAKNAPQLLTLSTKLLEQGINLERLATQLINILRDYIVYLKTQNQAFLTYLQIAEVRELNWDLNFAYQSTEILMALVAELKTTTLPAQVFEVALLKLLNLVATKAQSEVLSSDNQADQVVGKIPSTKEPLVTNKATKKLATPKAYHEPIDVATNNLNTSEILAKRAASLEKPLEDQVPKGEELDLKRLFNGDDPKITVIQPELKLDLPAIINLLRQADKAAALVAKQKLKAIPVLTSNEGHHSYVSLFDSMKLIAKGKNYVLIASVDEQAIHQIRADQQKTSLLDFAHEVFGEPTWIYALTLTEFEQVKTHYQDLAQQGKLPPVQVLKPPAVTAKTKSKEEEYGAKIFGNLFN